ncbi:hypothetical protein H632_c1017p0, partial [Helicosporidium sp. ATCC 50920]
MWLSAPRHIQIWNEDVSKIQWAPAAPGSRRALNFDVYLPAFPTVRFNAQNQENFVAAFATTFPDAEWSILHVVESSRGVTVRTQAVFSANPNADWLPPARLVYAMLRTGTCAQALQPGVWALSSVQQVVFPYLISSGSSQNYYVPGTMVHGLNINLLLKAHDMDWLTLPRAFDLVVPLQAMSETIASNVWKHTYVMPNLPARVVATIQTASFSARALAEINSQIKDNSAEIWPVSVWGATTILPGAQVIMLGGIQIPVFGGEDSNLVQCDEVDAADYPYTGEPIQANFCGQAMYGIYVGYRLVGFAPLAAMSGLSAVSNGITYK